MRMSNIVKKISKNSVDFCAEKLNKLCKIP